LAQALLANIRQRWEGLPGTKTIDYFSSLAVMIYKISCGNTKKIFATTTQKKARAFVFDKFF
jgi:hypothetical protein